MGQPFIRCGYCDSDQHTTAECPTAAEVREIDDDDDDDDDTGPVVIDDDEWD